MQFSLPQEIESKHGEMAKKYLINVVKASDLVRAMAIPRWQLVRPEGPAPWEEGFVAPKSQQLTDRGNPWYIFFFSVSDNFKIIFISVDVT